ncbi:unnamed protein product [Gongylonema pulchrum]|uniref:Uncharacterized protein n=1 Tax=Gongylonema pulchrum TaxID=637853 RepID=A0A3P7PRM5_9BILA|nr:unnamed protein product [Gongylonema pulchrum]
MSITLDTPPQMFEPSTYLNTHTPTPITSFLTANYRARASSKVFKRRSRKSKTSTEMEGGGRPRKLSLKIREDLEESFNRVMDQERELRDKARSVADFNKWEGLQAGPAYETDLFKKLLIACCDGCQRRAKILEEESREVAEEEEPDESDDENAFECGEQDKEDIHETLANMFFTKVALPEMEYVEDFADFLISAELHSLPVLKRACEGYLCSELYSKKDLIASLLLDLLFLSIVFDLPLMKSMTLSELSSRPEELAQPDALLELDEYKNLDRRMMKMSGRSLVELIEEVQRFREQRLRTQSLEIN